MTRTAKGLSLTRREQQVAALIARGQRNWEVGRALGIAENTVKRHVDNALHKLGAHSRTALVVVALETRRSGDDDYHISVD